MKKQTNPKFYYCQDREEERPMCKTQCEHCKNYYAPLEKNMIERIKKEDDNLYKKYQRKESRYRAELGELFDFYEVGKGDRSKISSLSRKVTTMKNLKKGVGTISELEQAISDAESHHYDCQYYLSQLKEVKEKLIKMKVFKLSEESNHLASKDLNVVQTLDNIIKEIDIKYP